MYKELLCSYCSAVQKLVSPSGEHGRPLVVVDLLLRKLFVDAHPGVDILPFVKIIYPGTIT